MDSPGDFDQTQAVVLEDFDDDLTDELESNEEKKPAAFIRVLFQRGLTETTYPLYEGDNIIGRQADTCHVCISSKSLSKEHACVQIAAGSHLISDKNSCNKTRRGKLVLRPEAWYELKHGDEIAFADVKCIYEISKQMSEIVPETDSENDVSDSLLLQLDVTEERSIDVSNKQAGGKVSSVEKEENSEAQALSTSDNEKKQGNMTEVVQETLLFEDSDPEISEDSFMFAAATQAYTADSKDAATDENDLTEAATVAYTSTWDNVDEEEDEALINEPTQAFLQPPKERKESPISTHKSLSSQSGTQGFETKVKSVEEDENDLTEAATVAYTSTWDNVDEEEEDEARINEPTQAFLQPLKERKESPVSSHKSLSSQSGTQRFETKVKSVEEDPHSWEEEMVTKNSIQNDPATMHLTQVFDDEDSNDAGLFAASTVAYDAEDNSVEVASSASNTDENGLAHVMDCENPLQKSATLPYDKVNSEKVNNNCDAIVTFTAPVTDVLIEKRVPDEAATLPSEDPNQVIDESIVKLSDETTPVEAPAAASGDSMSDLRNSEHISTPGFNETVSTDLAKATPKKVVCRKRRGQTRQTENNGNNATTYSSDETSERTNCHSLIESTEGIPKVNQPLQSHAVLDNTTQIYKDKKSEPAKNVKKSEKTNQKNKHSEDKCQSDEDDAPSEAAGIIKACSDELTQAYGTAEGNNSHADSSDEIAAAVEEVDAPEDVDATQLFVEHDGDEPTQNFDEMNTSKKYEEESHQAASDAEIASDTAEYLRAHLPSDDDDSDLEDESVLKSMQERIDDLSRLEDDSTAKLVDNDAHPDNMEQDKLLHTGKLRKGIGKETDVTMTTEEVIPDSMTDDTDEGSPMIQLPFKSPLKPAVINRIQSTSSTNKQLEPTEKDVLQQPTEKDVLQQPTEKDILQQPTEKDDLQQPTEKDDLQQPTEKGLQQQTEKVYSPQPTEKPDECATVRSRRATRRSAAPLCETSRELESSYSRPRRATNKKNIPQTSRSKDDKEGQVVEIFAEDRSETKPAEEEKEECKVTNMVKRRGDSSLDKHEKEEKTDLDKQDKISGIDRNSRIETPTTIQEDMTAVPKNNMVCLIQESNVQTRTHGRKIIPSSSALDVISSKTESEKGEVSQPVTKNARRSVKVTRQVLNQMDTTDNTNNLVPPDILDICHLDSEIGAAAQPDVQKKVNENEVEEAACNSSSVIDDIKVDVEKKEENVNEKTKGRRKTIQKIIKDNAIKDEINTEDDSMNPRISSRGRLISKNPYLKDFETGRKTSKQDSLLSDEEEKSTGKEKAKGEGVCDKANLGKRKKLSVMETSTTSESVGHSPNPKRGRPRKIKNNEVSNDDARYTEIKETTKVATVDIGDNNDLKQKEITGDNSFTPASNRRTKGNCEQSEELSNPSFVDSHQTCIRDNNGSSEPAITNKKPIKDDLSNSSASNKSNSKEESDISNISKPKRRGRKPRKLEVGSTESQLQLNAQSKQGSQLQIPFTPAVESQPVVAVTAQPRGRGRKSMKVESVTNELTESKESSSLDKNKTNCRASSESRASKRTGAHIQVPASPAKKSKITSTPQTPVGKSGVCKTNSQSPALRKSSTGEKPRVMFTGLIDEHGEKIVKDLGGEMATTIQECTHLVTDRVRRTVKFLSGLAKGLLIVSPRWLESCKQAGTFIDGHRFLVSDPAMEKQYKFNLASSIGRAQQSPILSGYRVHVSKSVKPDPAQMQDVLTCAGANYLATMPGKSHNKTVVISCKEDHKLCQPAIKAGIPIMEVEFILTGILRQELDFKSFLLPVEEHMSPPSGKSKARR